MSNCVRAEVSRCLWFFTEASFNCRKPFTFNPAQGRVRLQMVEISQINLFIHDKIGNQVLVFGPRGHFIRKIGQQGPGPPKKYASTKAVFQRNESVYIADMLIINMKSPQLKMVQEAVSYKNGQNA